MVVLSLAEARPRAARILFQHEEKLLIARIVAGLCFACISSLLIFFVSTGAGGEATGLVGEGIVVLLFIAIFGMRVRTIRRRLRLSAAETQKDRNRFASQVINSRGANVAHKFSLYIRPFIIDGQIRTSIGAYHDEIFTRLLHDSVENALTQAIDREFPVVALGGEPLDFGPGGASITDGEWQNRVAALMKAASLIVVVPIAQPSTLWEIKQLHARGMLHKTVFFVPPYGGHTKSYSSVVGIGSLTELYAYSHKKFERDGIPMPRIGRNGGLFWLHGVRENTLLWRYRVFKRAHHANFRSIRKIILETRNSPLLPTERFENSLDKIVGQA